MPKIHLVTSKDEASVLVRGGRPAKLFEIVDYIMKNGGKCRGKDLHQFFTRPQVLYSTLRNASGIIRDTSGSFPALTITDDLKKDYIAACKELGRTPAGEAPTPKKRADKYDLPPFPNTADTSATFSYFDDLSRALDVGPKDADFYNRIKGILMNFIYDMRYRETAQDVMNKASDYINRLKPRDASPDCELIELTFSHKLSQGAGWRPVVSREYYIRRLGWDPDNKEDATMDEFKAYFNGLKLKPTGEHDGEYAIVNKDGYETDEKVQFVEPYPANPRIINWNYK
jgi:hypothetical protein